jgi:hypothetical protein
MIEKFERIIAWAGLAFFSLCILYVYLGLWAVTHPISNYPGDSNTFFVLLYVLSFAGVIPMLVGGMGSKPRHFWLAGVIAGSAYIVSLVIYAVWGQFNQGNMHSDAYGIITGILLLAFLGIPGIISVGIGIRLRRKKNQVNSSSSFDEAVLQKSRD